MWTVSGFVYKDRFSMVGARMKKMQSGFTLLELLIVVGTIAIIASFAYPSYRDYVVRANRTDAMEALNEIMAQQQRFYARNRTYATNLTDLGYSTATLITDNTFYVVTATACASSDIKRCVLLTAAPDANKGQKGDGDITLSSRGGKTWNGQQGWNHK